MRSARPGRAAGTGAWVPPGTRTLNPWRPPRLTGVTLLMASAWIVLQAPQEVGGGPHGHQPTGARECAARRRRPRARARRCGWTPAKPCPSSASATQPSSAATIENGRSPTVARRRGALRHGTVHQDVTRRLGGTSARSGCRRLDPDERMGLRVVEPDRACAEPHEASLRREHAAASRGAAETPGRPGRAARVGFVSTHIEPAPAATICGWPSK